MKPRILQMAALSPALDAALKSAYEVCEWWLEPDPEGFLQREGETIVGIATAAPFGVPTALVNALPNLKVISCRGVGLDKIDLDNARLRGIQVAGTPGTLTGCVADLGFALLMDCARQLSAADRFVRGGRWSQGRYPLTSRVFGKRLGIVGMGQIGQAVARRSSGFDMPVGYVNRSARPELAHEYFDSLQGLADWSDFLVVTVAGGEETRNLIDESVLRALGPNGILINISRGSVVDQPALIQALKSGTIRGAGLDVLADEPSVPAALLKLDNVVLSPHMASGTLETRQAMEDLVLENLQRFFSEGRVRTPAFE